MFNLVPRRADDTRVVSALPENETLNQLEKALTKRESEVDFAAVEQDWRALYPVAWADFHRFVKGWSPGHWKINGYSERLTREVIAQLG